MNLLKHYRKYFNNICCCNEMDKRFSVYSVWSSSEESRWINLYSLNDIFDLFITYRQTYGTTAIYNERYFHLVDSLKVGQSVFSPMYMLRIERVK